MQIHTYTHTKKKTKQQQQQQYNSNKLNHRLHTFCDVNNEDTITHSIALMTSPSRVQIPYALGAIIK